MLPDLARMKNGEMDISALRIAHFRAHGHALGASVTKRCDLKGQLERCPACHAPAADDEDHCLLHCQAPALVEVRRRHLSQYVASTSAIIPKWAQLYNNNEGAVAQVSLILNAANFIEDGPDFRATRTRLADWLKDVKQNHPTYRKEQFQQGIGTLNYYETERTDQTRRRCDYDTPRCGEPPRRCGPAPQQ
jgi:hypothetical protein